MNKDVLAPQLRGFVSGVIDTPSKGVSRYTLAVLLLFTLALSACGGEDTPPAESLLAVAYINSDGQPEYSESDDILIAGLFDTDRDGLPSVGDTVRYFEAPLDFTGQPSLPFVVVDLLVTNVIGYSGSFVSVAASPPGAPEDAEDVQWTRATVLEAFTRHTPARATLVEIEDCHDVPFCFNDETIVVQAAVLAAGPPGGIFEVRAAAGSDDDFLNVQLNFTVD